MREILNRLISTASNMYRLGWHERNSGNISVLLDAADLAGYADAQNVIREIPLGFDCGFSGKVFLVTGTGKYFKNFEKEPQNSLGIVRIKDGKTAELLWGFSDGGKFTSEFPAHLLSHIARLKVNPKNRVIIHSHPTNLLAINYVHELDDKKLTRTLWRMCTECIVIFPEGIGTLPWMVCGNNDIAQKTAEKMKDFRLVVWGMHGIIAAGNSLDEAFGLIETAEKAAQIYITTAHLPQKNTITDTQLKQLAKAFKISYRKEFLE